MRTHYLQKLLALLLLSARGVRVHANTRVSASGEACTIQAWVRAPDLVPGTIVQGDARLKLATGCTAVESASLGLRFKERSFVKASRSMEATKQPAREVVKDIFDPELASPSSPWALPTHHDFNCSADIAYAEIVKNKNLWLVREEERVVFESMQTIDMGEAQPGSIRDVVRDFAILVPLTNFPLALDYPRSFVRLREGEFVNVEEMYEYFVRIAFANGTRVEVPAGFTAFLPLYSSPNNNLVRSKTVQLQTKESLHGSLVDSDPVANYTAEIISKHDGFAFSQGSDDQFVEVTITRTGRARAFVETPNLHLCIDSSLVPRWASEHTSDPTQQSIHRPNRILRATSTDFKTPSSPGTSRCMSPDHDHMSDPRPIFMPDATSNQIAAGEIVTTTSEPVRFLIDADPRHVTDFETHYYTLSSALLVSLDVPRTQDEPPNVEDVLDLRAIRKKTPAFEADEEPWVPWHSVPEVTRWRGHRAYTGNVSASVYPSSGALLPEHCAHPTTKQVVMTNREDEGNLECALHLPVHYLSEGARAPVFVDGNAQSVQALHAKTPAERDTLAPSLQPVVSSPVEGEERVHRYYRVPQGQRPPIYVGETWVKKVAHREEHTVTAPRPDVMPDALAQMAAVMKHMFDEL